MSNVLVQISDMATSQSPADTISTVGLGSCIAVVLYDPTRTCAGLLHYMLPLSKTAPDQARARPAMFADTGVPALFSAMESLGCTRGNLVVKAAGGASLNDDKGVYQIGKRNVNVLRKLLWKNGISIAAHDVGGTWSRNVSIEVATGKVVVRAQGKKVEL